MSANRYANLKPSDQKNTSGQRRQRRFEEKYSIEPVMCYWCLVNRAEGDHYPYCSLNCAISAEND